MNIKLSLIIALLIFFGILGIPTIFVSAQNVSQDQQTTILQLQEQIKTLQAQIEQLKAELATTKVELVEVKAELKFTKTLVRGMAGDEVKQLQEFLRQFSDIYPEGLVTGYFGPLTEAAVKRLQEKENIESVGVVGPKTRAKLNELVVATPATPSLGVDNPAILATSSAGVDNPTILATSSAPAVSATPTTTPSDTIPAIPATPAEPALPPAGGSGGGGGATPATPAVPATPAQPSPPPPQDTTPPTISNVQAVNITETSAIIT